MSILETGVMSSTSVKREVQLNCDQWQMQSLSHNGAFQYPVYQILLACKGQRLVAGWRQSHIGLVDAIIITSWFFSSHTAKAKEAASQIPDISSFMLGSHQIGKIQPWAMWSIFIDIIISTDNGMDLGKFCGWWLWFEMIILLHFIWMINQLSSN